MSQPTVIRNSRQPLLLYIHIPKTAGSSFREQVVMQNVPKQYYKRFRGVKDLVRTDSGKLKVIGGHMPYGCHILLKGEQRYITFLRSPIDRAISHYFYLVQSPGPKYPNANKFDRQLHQAHSLKDIFNVNQRRKYKFHTFALLDNLQTRYLAGYRHFYKPKDSKSMLKAAKEHLQERIDLFGIKEEYDKSLEIFQSAYGWKIGDRKPKLRNTRIKKTVDEPTLNIVRENHVLDLELYDFARDLFHQKAKNILGC